MKVSIGILAHNEASSIRRTLQSLLQQSLFQSFQMTPNTPPIELEIIGVPNGCSDNTAAIMHDTLSHIAPSAADHTLTWKICELPQPGKPNAWNHYVHEFSSRNADYLILMDADIWFPDRHTLSAMVHFLMQEKQVWVAVDRPVKDVVLKANKTVVEHLSNFVSELSGSGGTVWLCGQLYCARADILRQIYMPAALTAEDGFLYQMVTTNCLTTPSQAYRIARVPDALHVFEAYTHPRQLLRHERWLVVTNITNTLIFEHLQRCLTQTATAHTASALFREWDEKSPHWVTKLIQAERLKQSGWLSPPEFLMRRFVNLRNKSLIKACCLLPVAIVAMLVDLLALYAANRQLSKI